MGTDGKPSGSTTFDFVVFRRLRFRPFFNEFWQRVTIHNTKDEVVYYYEIALTSEAIKHRLVVTSYFHSTPIDEMRVISRNLRRRLKISIERKSDKELRLYPQDIFDTKVNVTHLLWDTLIKLGLPFIKIEVLRKNPFKISRTKVFQTIEKYSNYEAGIISVHLTHISRSSPTNLVFH